MRSDSEVLDTMWSKWIATRPSSVQEFSEGHPDLKPGAIVCVGGERLHFIGFAEYVGDKVGLILSTVDPCVDYEGAMDSRVDICPDHQFTVETR